MFVVGVACGKLDVAGTHGFDIGPKAPRKGYHSLVADETTTGINHDEIIVFPPEALGPGPSGNGTLRKMPAIYSHPATSSHVYALSMFPVPAIVPKYLIIFDDCD